MSPRCESALGNYCPHCAIPFDTFTMLQKHVNDKHHLYLRSCFGARNTVASAYAPRAAKTTIPDADAAVS